MRIAKLSLTLIFGVLEPFWHSFIRFRWDTAAKPIPKRGGCSKTIIFVSLHSVILI